MSSLTPEQVALGREYGLVEFTNDNEQEILRRKQGDHYVCVLPPGHWYGEASKTPPPIKWTAYQSPADTQVDVCADDLPALLALIAMKGWLL